MRADIVVQEVIAKCDVLKRAGLWLPEPSMRPRAWLQNFDEEDKRLAALLLDKFTFYNSRLTDALLKASYHSIADGMPKGPRAPCRTDLVHSLSTAMFTPVRGEHPNPTDSGYLLCRKARQLIGVPEARILDTDAALNHAYTGGTVIFLDDFVGSGDQFLTTWKGDPHGKSFRDARIKTNFVAIYITLISTDFGLQNINTEAPDVAVCATHILEPKSTLHGLVSQSNQLKDDVDKFLNKYAMRLRPTEPYIAKNSSFVRYGYKNRSLLLGFEHSIPDATLPIFWSPGEDDWEPLIERT